MHYIHTRRYDTPVSIASKRSKRCISIKDFFWEFETVLTRIRFDLMAYMSMILPELLFFFCIICIQANTIILYPDPLISRKDFFGELEAVS